jgi:hypothetical protein
MELEKSIRLLPNYYEVKRVHRKYGAIFDKKGNEINEQERGLMGLCPTTKKSHEWLILPIWTEAVKTGGKQYIECLQCGERGHL